MSIIQYPFQLERFYTESSHHMSDFSEQPEITPLVPPMTFNQARKALHVGRNTLYRLMDEGLPSYKVGERWRFWPEDLRGVAKRAAIIPAV